MAQIIAFPGTARNPEPAPKPAPEPHNPHEPPKIRLRSQRRTLRLDRDLVNRWDLFCLLHGFEYRGPPMQVTTPEFEASLEAVMDLFPPSEEQWERLSARFPWIKRAGELE